MYACVCVYISKIHTRMYNALNTDTIWCEWKYKEVVEVGSLRQKIGGSIQVS